MKNMRNRYVGVISKGNKTNDDLQIKLKQISELKIKQVKISTIYDKNNKSYIKHFSDTLKFIRLILRSIFRK